MTPTERPPRTAAEWWTFAVALALIGAVAGVILASWIAGPSGPAVLEAGPSGPPVKRGVVYRVPFEVRNTGGEAATDVQVVAELRIDGEPWGRASSRSCSSRAASVRAAPSSSRRTRPPAS